MRIPKSVFVVAQTAITALIAVAAVQVMADDNLGPPDAPASALGNGFTYQGRLTGPDGAVTGTCDMAFTLWDAPELGFSTGFAQTIPDVPIENGLFAVILNSSNEFGTTPFRGQDRWLQVSLDCTGGGFEVLTTRQQLTATPYALGLRPGAHIEGNLVSGALVVENSGIGGEGIEIGPTGGVGLRIDSTGSQGIDIEGTNGDGITMESVGGSGVAVESADGHGLLVQNAGGDGLNVEAAEGFGVIIGEANLAAFKGHSLTGHGIDASTESALSYAGFFTNSAANGRGAYTRSGSGIFPDLVLGGNDASALGDDGRIGSDPAYPDGDIYLDSRDGIVLQLDIDGSAANANMAVITSNGTRAFEVDENADFHQPPTGFGLPKMVVYVFCSNNSSVIYRSSTTVANISLPSVTNGTGEGECSVDFGFDVSSSFIYLTADSNLARLVTFSFSGTDNQDLQLYRHQITGGSGVGLDGPMMVVIF